MPVSASSVNHVCPFKYHARVSDRTNSDLHHAFALGKIEKRKKICLNKPQNSSKIVFVLQSIHRVKKKHI